MRSSSLAGFVLATLLLVLAGVGCSPKRFAKIPGETDAKVRKVEIKGEKDERLHVEWEPLLIKLGLRAGGLVYTDRYFNPFRLAEDRRRVQAYFQTYGYFDAEVLEPALEWNEDKSSVAVTWTVREGKLYRMESVHVEKAPKGLEDTLQKRVPFGPGDPIDLETYRKVRYTLADFLQRDGYGHARVYSRTYVDRAQKKLHWYYFVDAGPRTRIGTIRVDGSKKVPEDVVLARIGLKVGDPYTLTAKEKAEFDLLDTGAFASAVLDADVDTELYIGDVPDTGGVISDAQIDESGDLVPRKLSEDVAIVVRVVEAPSRKLEVRAGAEADSHRIDATVGAGVRFRNALGAQHHVSVEGRLGYGYVWRTGGDNDELSGVYGDARIRYDHPGFIARLLDFRLTARYRDVLYPSFHLRELTTGPGIRTAITREIFFDLDAFFRLARSVGFGPFDDATRSSFSLPVSDDFKGGELDTSLVWDARNDPIEPMRGHLFALRASGAPVGDTRYLVVSGDARAFFSMSDAWSIGMRASAGFVPAHSGDGVPLGPRLFGGGAFGMRGFFRNRLSPIATSCPPPPGECRNLEVGGLSLAEGSIEARWLAFQKPIGAIVFTDVGGAGISLNPFESGPSFASGIGLRVRTWFAPIGVDVAYRWMRDGKVESFGWDPFHFFVRIGEAF